jgi:aminopeptidase N
VRVWYRPGTAFSASTALEQASRAIERMGALVGPYPYLHFKVVQSPGGYGMESPGLIWIPTGTPSSNMPYLVHHETAHQWFYSLVGNDQASEPFADEAAADFLARDVLGMRRSSRCSTGRLDLSIYQYSSACYYEVVYIQGGNFLNEIRGVMGSTAFWRGMRAYVTERRWHIAQLKTLLDTLDAHTPVDLRARYEARFPRLY